MGEAPLSDGLIEGQFADGPPACLFNLPDYFHLHDHGRGRYFQWAHAGAVSGTIHFTEVDRGSWRSPAVGTFGGYSLKPGVAVERFAAFHEAVESRLIALGAGHIEILLAPADHDPALFATSVYLLLARGFTIGRADLNYAIEVTPQAFAERVTYGNRKRLNKAARAGLVARRLASEDLAAVYDVIARNRAARDFPVSMSLPQLEQMVGLFPDRFALFGVEHDGALIASAVCIAVTRDVLYTFYWGDLPGFTEYSPVVSLAGAIYDFARQAGFRLVDAGTSTLGPDPNLGLIRFKRGIGFSESLKLRMLKSI